MESYIIISEILPKRLHINYFKGAGEDDPT